MARAAARLGLDARGRGTTAIALHHTRSHEWISFSHNILLDLLVWNGVVIGGLVCVAITGWIASRCLRCRDAGTWAMLAAGGVLLTHALLEYPHAYAYFLLPMAVFIGVVEARVEDGGPKARFIPSVPNWTFGVLSAAMAGCLIWVCLEYLEIEEAHRRVRFKEAGYVIPARSHGFPMSSCSTINGTFCGFA